MRVLPVGALLAVALGLGLGFQPAPVHAGGGKVAGPPAVVTIIARDFSFEAPDVLPSGIVSLTLRNEGQEDHQVQFLRLNEGVSVDQLLGALQGSPEAAFALVSVAGGVNVVAPGQSAQATVNLTPGNYVMVCFVTSANGVPHVAEGMWRPFQVAAEASPLTPPQSDGTITLQDFTITMPPITAGAHTLEVVNRGPEPHEIVVMRAEGATLAQVQEAAQHMEEEPPFPLTSVGGLGAINAGERGWVTMDFTPGIYVALCFVPDPATGKAHAELGMVTVFEVQ